MTARGLKLSSFLELCKKTTEDVLVNMLYVNFLVDVVSDIKVTACVHEFVLFQLNLTSGRVVGSGASTSAQIDRRRPESRRALLSDGGRHHKPDASDLVRRQLLAVQRLCVVASCPLVVDDVLPSESGRDGTHVHYAFRHKPSALTMTPRY